MTEEVRSAPAAKPPAHVRRMFLWALWLAVAVAGLAIVIAVTAPTGPPLRDAVPGLLFVVVGLLAIARHEQVSTFLWHHAFASGLIWAAALGAVVMTGATGPYGASCLIAVGLSSILGQTRQALLWAALSCAAIVAVAALEGRLGEAPERQTIVVNLLIYVGIAGALITAVAVWSLYVTRGDLVIHVLAMDPDERERLALESLHGKILRRLGLLGEDAFLLLSLEAQGSHLEEIATPAAHRRRLAPAVPGPREPGTELVPRPRLGLDPGAANASRRTIGRRLRTATEVIGARSRLQLIAALIASLRERFR